MADDPRWRGVGVLATLLGALPVIVLEIGPGETAHLPDLPAYHGPVGLVLGKYGGVTGPALARAVTLQVELPDHMARTQHWHAALHDISLAGDSALEETETGAQLRMTSGNLRRTAKLAAAVAALEGRTTITLHDVRQASRSLNRQALETLATHLPPAQTTPGDAWRDLAVSAETQRDLEDLELRCRFRETLHDAVGSAVAHQLNTGVRALMSGPSGTGKTLAARLLATALQMDLYRVDLATVVNKYIGETEKNLNQLFTRAEELDVILLLDEGDALLTQRTQVQSSNDRYANLETNYLLQRIEQFEGILLVTTNAGDRIDRAFQRRMDVVIDFRPPDAGERWAIWQIHLPTTHIVDHTLLQEVAVRCTLTGGQIRNAALHAALLALHEGDMVGSDHVERAIQREYRKSGAVCPLRLHVLA
jgi:SpoVK/Ycf46/Vps4 family AAA+-type ATPase